MVAFANLVNLVVLKDLVSDYVDLKMKAMEMEQQARMAPACEPRPLFPPVDHFRTISVQLKKGTGTKLALVDDAMYEELADQEKYCWRTTSSGYVVSNINRKCVYMHKVVYGGPARHINGDRFDNRLSNLAPSPRAPKDDQDEGDFAIRTIRQLEDSNNSFQKDDPKLGEFKGFGMVRYDDRSYEGELFAGKPYGYGVLRRESKERCYDMIGFWKAGHMQTGIVSYFKPAPACMCQNHQQCPLREITGMEIIDGGVRIRTVQNPFHGADEGSDRRKH